jgi:predicted CXXCH cytochrome family protein
MKLRAAILLLLISCLAVVPPPPDGEQGGQPIVIEVPKPGPAPLVSNGQDWSGYARGVVGSAHDLTGAEGNACNTCHIPHVQGIRPSSQPSTQPAVELFRIRGQRSVFVPGRYTPGPTSLICLGCHDGTVATSTISSSHAMLAGVRVGFEVPDGFVWRDHPIGVLYPPINEPGEFHPGSFVAARGIRMPEGRVECISCHDPHNETGVKYMLTMSNKRSALCLTCHIK